MYDLNQYKFVRIIKWLFTKLYEPFFLLKYKIYANSNKKKKYVRLFDTTGNISLLNALTIIKEEGDYEKYDDILIIDSGKGKSNFKNDNLEIAKIHNFKKIIFRDNLRLDIVLLLNNLYKIDLLYLMNHPIHLPYYLNLYKDTPIYIIDEGASSLVNAGVDKIKNLKAIRTHLYLNKLDFCNIDDINKIKFEPLDINEFRKIAEALSEKYPIEIKSSKEDKAILYCGIYWEVSGLDRDTFIQIQNETINNLLNAGYKILYKPHPRDTEFYGLDKNPNVEFINSKFPIELYNLDVLAIVSLSSTTSLSPGYYWSIPCFSNVIEESLKDNKFNININRLIVKEYSPNYKALLNLDVKNTSREELKLKIKGIYNDFLKDKPLLSQNKNIKEFIRGMNEIK